VHRPTGGWAPDILTRLVVECTGYTMGKQSERKTEEEVYLLSSQSTDDDTPFHQRRMGFPTDEHPQNGFDECRVEKGRGEQNGFELAAYSQRGKTEEEVYLVCFPHSQTNWKDNPARQTYWRQTPPPPGAVTDDEVGHAADAARKLLQLVAHLAQLQCGVVQNFPRLVHVEPRGCA
jgi:hypothetical protein